MRGNSREYRPGLLYTEVLFCIPGRIPGSRMWKNGGVMSRHNVLFWKIAAIWLAVSLATAGPAQAQGNSVGNRKDGKHLFESETFGGNGRPCLTCHSSETGTVSPLDALTRFQN